MRTDKSVPGIYMRIAVDSAAFRDPVNAAEFVERFGEIRGSEHKRIPPEFQAADADEPLIAKSSITLRRGGAGRLSPPTDCYR